MLHEAKDRQKFVSDAQYLRDMQHKVDSEYQACLRRQEQRRDSTDKKRDQLWVPETNLERSRFSSGSSSKQSSVEEDPLAEPRLSAKTSMVKCDSKLPAIDQTSVKQKHKSTMTPRKPEKLGPSKPSPNPAAQQEGPVWANDTKLKRPIRERRNLVLSSQLATAENIPERASKRDWNAFSQSESHSALSHTFQGTNSPQVLSESLGPSLTSTPKGGPRRAPFRFRDEDFYSILSLNTGKEYDDTEEEAYLEEELLLVGMHPPCSPSIHKRSRFLGTSTTQVKNKNFEEDPENHRANSSRRSELSHGSLRISNAMEPVTEQPSVRQKMFQDPGLIDGEAAKGNGSGDNENENKAFHSWDTKSVPRQKGGLNAESLSTDCTSMADRSGTYDYERDWKACLNSSRNSLDYLSSGRPTLLRSSVNSSYFAPGSSLPSALRDNIPVDLSMSSTLVHSSDSEGNSRFNVRRPLSPIRNRNPFANAENHSCFPRNSTHEFDVRGAEDISFTSQLQEAPLNPEDLLLNPQGDLSSVDSSSSSQSRMNLRGHLHMSASLQENPPFTFFLVSDFPNQNDNGNRVAASGSMVEKEATKVKADPEKLKKLQESLLEEDSEEEGDLCRICQIAGGSPTNPLLEPCGCVGSLQFVHQECLKKWLKVKITSGADLGAVKTCEMCKQSLMVDLDDLNLNEFYQKHQQSRQPRHKFYQGRGGQTWED